MQAGGNQHQTEPGQGATREPGREWLPGSDGTARREECEVDHQERTVETVRSART